VVPPGPSQRSLTRLWIERQRTTVAPDFEWEISPFLAAARRWAPRTLAVSRDPLTTLAATQTTCPLFTCGTGLRREMRRCSVERTPACPSSKEPDVTPGDHASSLWHKNHATHARHVTSGSTTQQGVKILRAKAPRTRAIIGSWGPVSTGPASSSGASSMTSAITTDRPTVQQKATVTPASRNAVGVDDHPTRALDAGGTSSGRVRCDGAASACPWVQPMTSRKRSMVAPQVSSRTDSRA